MAPTEPQMRRFRPTLASSLALGALAAAFAALGAWQLQRAAWKQDLQDRFDDRSAPPAWQLPANPGRFTRVVLRGRFDGRRLFFIDNRVSAGRPGVHVLDPFSPEAGGPVLLVNRGWAPMPPDRSALPAVAPVTGTVTVSGYLDLVRQPGVTLGEPERLAGDDWPKLVTYPDTGMLEDALGTPLYPMALYLDADAPGALTGFDRDPFPMPAARHRGYALTWFALLLACGVAWTVLGLQHARRTTQ